MSSYETRAQRSRIQETTSIRVELLLIVIRPRNISINNINTKLSLKGYKLNDNLKGRCAVSISRTSLTTRCAIKSCSQEPRRINKSLFNSSCVLIKCLRGSGILWSSTKLPRLSGNLMDQTSNPHCLKVIYEQNNQLFGRSPKSKFKGQIYYV